jgi:hypothetical protein
VMNFSVHGRPTATSFFTNGRRRSDSGDRTPAIFSATPARDSFAGHCS